MSYQFSRGEPALVVGGEAFLGCQVEVVCCVEPGGWIYYGGDRVEQYGQDEPPGWAVNCAGMSTVKCIGEIIPLRGDFSSENQKELEVIA